MTATASEFFVAPRQPAVRGPDAAEVVLRGLFDLFSPRLLEGFVGARKQRRKKPSGDARLPAGRGSFAMLIGVHMFKSVFGGVR